MEFKELFNKKDEYFQRILGVDKITFQKLLIILKTKINQKIILKGRPFNLDLENRLVMTLRLLYENRTYHSIDAEYNLSKSSVARNVQWICETLNNNESFQTLKNNKIFLKWK